MPEGEVTQLLSAVGRGAEDALARLIEVVHAELRRMAAAKMGAEAAGHTLQPTELVNEAFLRLAGTASDLEDRAHFFGAAAKAMERVLIDHARRKGAAKRGGAAVNVTLHEVVDNSMVADLGVIDVHEAVEQLEQEDAAMAELARLRCFLGLTLEQVAEVQGVSLATVKRRWTYVRAWLYDRLEP